MNRYFYIDAEGKQKGTFSSEELKEEPICANTLIWTQGWSKWVLASEIPELQNMCHPMPAMQSNVLPISPHPSPNPYQAFVVTPTQPSSSNGIGVAGFVLAVISAFLGWIPFLGWLLWFLGLIFSFAGIFKKPRGLAIAGLCISLIWIILVLFLGAFGLLLK